MLLLTRPDQTTLINQCPSERNIACIILVCDGGKLSGLIITFSHFHIPFFFTVSLLSSWPNTPAGPQGYHLRHCSILFNGQRDTLDEDPPSTLIFLHLFFAILRETKMLYVGQECTRLIVRLPEP